MQSILQRRKIRRKLEQQFVTKNEKPEDAWTNEGRYYYREGEIHTHPREPEDDPYADRRREHGHQTFISGPSLQPRHSVRSHLEREGDVETVGEDPELQQDPHTINTAETLGNTPELMVTGIERLRPGTRVPSEFSEGASTEVDDRSIKSESDIDSLKKGKLILVTFEGDFDKMDPHNWSIPRRMCTTVLTSLLACVIFWSSTIDATAVNSTQKLFHTSFEIQTLSTSMFLIGNGIGALITAPISEMFGRSFVYIPTMIGFLLFNMGAGLSQSLPQRVVCRGLAGFFGSAPAVLAAATLVDVWSRTERVYAFPLSSIIAFTGPLVGPTAGSFLVASHSLSWRWVDWITIIFAGLMLIPVVLFLPETYSPILLYWKSKELRRMTGDDRYRSPMEFKRVSFGRRLRGALYRPLVLFGTEPIIMISAIHLCLLFIVLYTFISGYVSIYEHANNFSPTSAALAFLGIEVGVILSALLTPLTMWLLRRQIYRSRARGFKRPPPEISLYMAMFGGPFVPIGLFWMGWTAKLEISFWSPLIASAFFGFGTLCVFVSGYQYVADSFEMHSASALSSLQMLRLVAAGVMASISQIMYNKLGTAYTLTVLGGISIIFVPVPYLLYWKGDKVRSWSRYARRTE